MVISIANIINGSKRKSLDADAKAFLVASGTISDPIITSAINEFVVGMKENDWWDKCDIIYPIVGGTQSTHMWNLKDPRNLDAAFRLTFTSGWSHNSSGMNGNGIGYANTYFNPNTHGVQNQHISENCITDSDGNIQEIGVEGSGTELSQWMSVFGGAAGMRIYGNNDFYTTSTSIGFQLSQRQNNTQCYSYRNTGSTSYELYNASSSFGGFPTQGLTLGAKRFNSGAIGGYSNRTFNFISVGSAFPQTQVDDFGALVLQLQTNLGR